jgi:DNA repair photolyase
LSQPNWTVRALTKNAAIQADFDLIERYRDRVLVGLSITATPDKAHLAAVIEPNASSIHERISVLREAHRRGLRTYMMLCPLLPGIASSPEDVGQLLDLAFEVGAEEIFLEPFNPRGRGLELTVAALRAAGHVKEAEAVRAIGKKPAWSKYTADLLQTVQAGLRKRNAIDRLRFLLYPSGLQPSDRKRIECDDEGVRWLGDADEPQIGQPQLQHRQVP